MNTPRWLDTSFGLLSLALAGLVGVAIQREIVRPPDPFQRIVPALNVVDRCENCHEVAKHSGDTLETHPPEQFGCTMCHGGQGWAVTAEAAHEESLDWERPLLTDAAREAACGRCHPVGPLAGAPLLTRGRETVERLGCRGCHDLHETSQAPIGPELTGLADKLDPAWVRAWLKDPGALDARHRMPRFSLSDEQIEALVAWLFTVPGPAVREGPEGDADRGRVAVSTRRCATCHQIEGRGNTFAVGLDAIGVKVKPAWLFTYLSGTHNLRPGSPMPDFRLPEREAADIVAYAQEQLVPDTAELPWSKLTRPVDASKIETGRRLFVQLGCRGCHDVPGVPKERPGSPLVGIGRRRVGELLHPSNGDPLPDMPTWIALKVRDPHAFDTPDAPPAAMPTFRLEEGEAAAIGVAVSALHKEVPPAEYLRLPERPPFAPPPGDINRLFERYRCLVCHRIDGTGGDISRIPLDGAGARLDRTWLAGFLASPTTIRMDQPERMPVLGISPDEAERLAMFVAVNLDDARVPAEAPALDPASAARGREVYQARHCARCHVAAGEGEMKGPVLDGAARRLRPAYLVAMLGDPALVPEGRHGDVRLAPDDARAVAAWLTSLAAPVAPP